MTAEMLLIAAVRILGSLPVLRWPFYGAVVAVLVDQSDLFMMNLLDLGGVKGYQSFDKYLDQVYLALFLFVALTRCRGPERNVAAGLYAYRFAGFVAFEISRSRHLLLFFPNLFEFWYLFVAARHQYRLEARLTGRRLLLVLIPLIALKLLQEYAIHRARWLDDFTAVEAVEAVWDWLTPI
jgi:hypothetical protein